MRTEGTGRAMSDTVSEWKETHRVPSDYSRAIKAALESHYGRGKVRVKSGTGTAWGNLTIGIDYPASPEEANRVDAILASVLGKPINRRDMGILVRLNWPYGDAL